MGKVGRDLVRTRQWPDAQSVVDVRHNAGGFGGQVAGYKAARLGGLEDGAGGGDKVTESLVFFSVLHRFVGMREALAKQGSQQLGGKVDERMARTMRYCNSDGVVWMRG